MPLPASLQTVTVTGTYVGFDGQPLVGTIRFEPVVPLVDTVGKVVIQPVPFFKTLDANGAFSIQLPATNDPDLNPIGFSYKVTEDFAGRAPSRTYFIQVPFDTVGSLDISQVSPLSQGQQGEGSISHNSLTNVTPNQHHLELHDDTKHTTATRVAVLDEGVDVAERTKLNFIGAGVVAADNPGTGSVDVTISGAAPPGYATVQDEGGAITQRTILNFVGAGVTVTDDGPGTRTKVDIPGASAAGYQEVQDEGTPATARTKLNFVGAGVTVTDDGPGTRTTVTIPSAAATTMPRPALCVVYSNDFPAALKTSIATYDFTCDAVNDQTEINNAITQAAITRGDVLLMGFLYKTRAPILMKTGVTLKALGMNTTRIEADTTGWAGDRLIGLNDVNVHATEMFDFWLDGKNIAGISGIAMDNTGGSFTGAPSTSPDPSQSVHDVRIYSCANKGLWLQGNNRGSEFHHLYIMNAGAEGLFVDSPDCDFANMQIGSSGGVGAFLGGSNCRYVNLKSWFSDSHGFQISNANRQALSNCEAQDNLGHGFYLTAGKQSLIGCHADSNSYDGSPSGAITGQTFFGFFFNGTGGVIAQACMAYDKNEGSRGTRQVYGFNFTAAAANCLVDGVTYGNLTGSVGGTVAGSTTTRIKSTDGK